METDLKGETVTQTKNKIDQVKAFTADLLTIRNGYIRMYLKKDDSDVINSIRSITFYHGYIKSKCEDSRVLVDYLKRVKDFRNEEMYQLIVESYASLIEDYLKFQEVLELDSEDVRSHVIKSFDELPNT